MAKEGLAFELRNILHKAKKENKPVLKENIPVVINNSQRIISIEAIPLPNIIEPHFLILFHDDKSADSLQSATGSKKTATPKTKKDDKDLHIEQLEKELAQTRKQVSLRYVAQLTAVENEQRDEFETPQDFNAKKDTQRKELIRQRDAELARLNVTVLASSETAPLRDSIKALAEREYIIVAESLVAELGTYDAVEKQFPISLHSKTPSIKLAIRANIYLPIAEAKVFKQQWLAGLVRPEAKVKSSGNLLELALVNDADSMRILNVNNEFVSPKHKADAVARDVAARHYLHYVYSYDGAEITDKKTGLIWRRCAEGMVYGGGTCTGAASQFNYEDALQHAAAQSRSTGVGWRVPEKDELLSIVDRGRKEPSIDRKAFPATPSAVFWSGSASFPTFADAWFVNFNGGGAYGYRRTSSYYVRLVRSGK